MLTGIIVTIAGFVATAVGFPATTRKGGGMGVLFGILLVVGVVMILCGVTLIVAPKFFVS